MIGITILHYTIVDKLGEGPELPDGSGQVVPHTFNSGDSILIGQTILYYKIIENLPSTEFIPSSSSGSRLNEVEGLRTSGEGGYQSRASYAWETKR